MKRSWTVTAVTLFALCVFAGCGDTNNSVQYNTGATITGISPSGIAAGTPSSPAQCTNTTTNQTFPCFTLFVIASASNPFLSTGTLPVVQWNGQKLITTFIDSTNLSAEVPYSLVEKPGSVAINTFQPQSGNGLNGLSNALTFIIYGAPNPVPTLSSVSPNSASYCNPSSMCVGIPITLTGNNFLPVSQNGGSSVTYTGLSTYGQEAAITVTSISSTQLKATIPGSLLCATDVAEINVINPPSAICIVNCPNLGGGDTNCHAAPAGSGCVATTQTFTVNGTAVTNSCPANVPPTIAVREATAAVSQDGRYVVYPSTQNGNSQILLRDTCLGAARECLASTRTVSIAADGSAGNSDSHNVSMSSDGRYVVFSSAATNLVENAAPGRQVYLRDTCIGATGSCKASTRLVSTDAEGNLAQTDAILPAISSSGRFVAFLGETRLTSNPVVTSLAAWAPAKSGLRQLFLRDTCLGATNCMPKTMLLSLLPGALGDSTTTAGPALAEETPAISQDGRYVAFAYLESGSSQILLRDTCLGVASGCTPSTRTISAVAGGSAGNGDSHNVSMTPDGRYVAFSSAATNLVENAPLGRQVYLRDTCIGAAACKAGISLASADEDGNLAGTESILPSLSTSGRFVAFLAVTPSQSGNAAAVPNSGLRQVFVRDMCLGASNCTPRTTRISLQPGDAPADSSRLVGPALAGLAKQVALADGRTSTVFTPTVPIDDRVFLAIPNETK